MIRPANPYPFLFPLRSTELNADLTLCGPVGDRLVLSVFDSYGDGTSGVQNGSPSSSWVLAWDWGGGRGAQASAWARRTKHSSPPGLPAAPRSYPPASPAPPLLLASHCGLDLVVGPCNRHLPRRPSAFEGAPRVPHTVSLPCQHTHTQAHAGAHSPPLQAARAAPMRPQGEQLRDAPTSGHTLTHTHALPRNTSWCPPPLPPRTHTPQACAAPPGSGGST